MKTPNLSFIVILILSIIVGGCNQQPVSTTTADDTKTNWLDELNGQIKLLGHRNWIVVADAAYPLQRNPGITTILSDENHTSTIAKVQQLITDQAHVRPVVYLDKEIDFVPEEEAPGIGDFRIFVEENFPQTTPQKVLHEDIISMLDEASELFNVVIIKTDFTIPYTSVFFQLDCQYWSGESEEAMRAKM